MRRCNSSQGETECSGRARIPPRLRARVWLIPLANRVRGGRLPRITSRVTSRPRIPGRCPAGDVSRSAGHTAHIPWLSTLKWAGSAQKGRRLSIGPDAKRQFSSGGSSILFFIFFFLLLFSFVLLLAVCRRVGSGRALITRAHARGNGPHPSLGGAHETCRAPLPTRVISPVIGARVALAVSP